MDAEFLRLPQVIQRVGLSRSEIYRRVSRSEFPRPRAYPNSRKRFWLSTEIAEWQRRAVGGSIA